MLRQQESYSDAARELLAQLYLIFPSIVSAPSSPAAVSPPLQGLRTIMTSRWI
jgi:hypothetical protein